MTQKQHKQRDVTKKVQFSFNFSQAKEVLLAGEFNQWKGEKHNMKKANQGLWEKTLMLKPGTYEYKYQVDGLWVEKPVNQHSRLNSFGTYNNVLVVKE